MSVETTLYGPHGELARAPRRGAPDNSPCGPRKRFLRLDAGGIRPCAQDKGPFQHITGPPACHGLQRVISHRWPVYPRMPGAPIPYWPTRRAPPMVESETAGDMVRPGSRKQAQARASNSRLTRSGWRERAPGSQAGAGKPAYSYHGFHRTGSGTPADPPEARRIAATPMQSKTPARPEVRRSGLNHLPSGRVRPPTPPGWPGPGDGLQPVARTPRIQVSG